METTLGGDRLGSGNKQNLSFRNYERSSHDLGYIWRSSMSAGTLVPFLCKLALPGDTWDIKLNAEVLTLPTVGPLFGSYKVQLDVFEVPMRLYNAKLHMNKLGVGMDMSRIFIPQLKVYTNNDPMYVQTFEDNEQINPSSLLKYLGISGLGNIKGAANPATRNFSAVPLLGYWDIYKNYYSNKQEEKGAFIHTSATGSDVASTPISARVYKTNGTLLGDALGATVTPPTGETYIEIVYPDDFGAEPDAIDIPIVMDGADAILNEYYSKFSYSRRTHTLTASQIRNSVSGKTINVKQEPSPTVQDQKIFQVEQFPLANIDRMRELILQYTGGSAYIIDNGADLPYSSHAKTIGAGAAAKYAVQFSQEGLALKTYQSDLFNNWVSTAWIDGPNGVNEITKVSVDESGFTIDSLNLAQKVYNMLNRIAVSGGTYDDWLSAVYTHERVRAIESPVYHGSLIKSLAFEEVISKADVELKGEHQPLGTLAGRGRMTSKHKGGEMVIKTNEPSYIIGLVSLTPLIDYSQGNEWDMNLKTFNDFHKPALDAIGFQDLLTDMMLWTDTDLNADTGELTMKTVGKQPAWINYMTSVNKVFGSFADREDSMFMVLNRRYENVLGRITDATTYIDPSKFNHIFAQTSLDSQNFWTQISVDITARRKMSAKVIPNL